MKRKLLLLMIVLFAISTTFAQTRELLNSEITATTTNYLPGTTVELQFHLDWESTDSEFIDGFSLDFPMGVNVNSASDILSIPITYYNGETGDGVLVTWGDIVGGSGFGPISTDYDFTVNVTIDPSFTGNMDIDWFIAGDIYGGEPHFVSGAFAIDGPIPIPISNWALYFGILLIGVFIVLRYRRIKLA